MQSGWPKNKHLPEFSEDLAINNDYEEESEESLSSVSGNINSESAL